MASLPHISQPNTLLEMSELVVKGSASFIVSIISLRLLHRERLSWHPCRLSKARINAGFLIAERYDQPLGWERVLKPSIPLYPSRNKSVPAPKHVCAPEKGGPQDRWTRMTWQWPWYPGFACGNAFKKVRVVRRKGCSDSATETRLCFVHIERKLWEYWV